MAQIKLSCTNEKSPTDITIDSAKVEIFDVTYSDGPAHSFVTVHCPEHNEFENKVFDERSLDMIRATDAQVIPITDVHVEATDFETPFTDDVIANGMIDLYREAEFTLEALGWATANESVSE